MGRSRPRASDPDDGTDELAHKIEERAPVPLPDVVPRSSLYRLHSTLPTSPRGRRRSGCITSRSAHG